MCIYIASLNPMVIAKRINNLHQFCTVIQIPVSEIICALTVITSMRLEL
jgi:hypothetical protein